MAKTAQSERRRTPAPTEPEPAIAPEPTGSEPFSFWRSLTPKVLLDSTPAEWLMGLPARRRNMLLLTVFAALIVFPYLGATGFWDCWEPEYDEVARQMIVRHDFIHPYYESGYFLSKPVLSFWLMAIGQLIANVNGPARGVSIWTEWCVRSLWALCAIGGMLMLYQGVTRTIGRRAAIWSAVIVASSPFYYLLTRQTMVDLPFVACNTAAIACLMIAVFEKETVQDGWLYAFYALAGVACLAKGLLGIAIPGGAFLFYLMLSGDWKILARLRLITGPLLTLAVMAPWYGTMLAFKGLDYEDQTNFFQRFIIHDHFQRIGFDPQAGQFVAGVHTTTPNTTFVYFMEQLGFGMFPWVALVPGAVAGYFASSNLTRPKTRAERTRLFVVAWAVFSFLFFSFAATKFHHYALPMVPPIAIILALYLEKVLDEGVSKHALPLVVGFVFFGLVAQNLAMEPKHLSDMFVYDYNRPYPLKAVDEGAALVIPGLGRFGPWTVSFQGLFGMMFGVAALVALMGAPQIRRWIAGPARWSKWYAAAVRLLGIEVPVSEEPSDRVFVVGALVVLAFAYAVTVSSWYWVKLSPHWSQRDLVWEYLQKSQPDEPLGAYLMNWKGETFYSRNLVRPMKEAGELRQFIDGPGDRKWLLVEQGRLGLTKNTIGAGYDMKVIDKSTSIKYVLAVVSKEAPSSSVQ